LDRKHFQPGLEVVQIFKKNLNVVMILLAPTGSWLLSKEGEVVCNVTVHKTGLSLRNWENPKEFPLLRAERQGRSLIARLRTEKPKYHTYNSRHAAPLVDICERKSRNTTNITHGMTQIIILFTSF
jgi:hypothetical protein